jgi:uncharacterized iron-regulated membrane protein
MTVKCPSCQFGTVTNGESFHISEQELNYCLKCGRPYPKGMVSVMYSANTASLKFMNRAVALILGCLVSILVILGGYIFWWSRSGENSPFKFVLPVALGAVVAAVVGVLLVVFLGDRKFKKLSVWPSKGYET